MVVLAVLIILFFSWDFLIESLVFLLECLVSLFEFLILLFVLLIVVVIYFSSGDLSNLAVDWINGAIELLESGLSEYVNYEHVEILVFWLVLVCVCLFLYFVLKSNRE